MTHQTDFGNNQTYVQEVVDKAQFTDAGKGISCAAFGTFYSDTQSLPSKSVIFGISGFVISLAAGAAVIILSVVSGGVAAIGSALLSGLLVAVLVYVGYSMYKCGSANPFALFGCMTLNLLSDLSGAVGSMACGLAGKKGHCLGGKIITGVLDPIAWIQYLKDTTIRYDDAKVECALVTSIN